MGCTSKSGGFFSGFVGLARTSFCEAGEKGGIPFGPLVASFCLAEFPVD